MRGKKGNVFVANTNADDVLEYPHGGTKPSETLQDLPNYYPSSCAVDPVSGDLAVTNQAISGTGNVVIFRHATGYLSRTPSPRSIRTTCAGTMIAGTSSLTAMGLGLTVREGLRYCHTAPISKS